MVSVPIFQVQHHEAHIASAIIDNDIKGEALGVAFDGTGYGTDSRIWGGEFFTGDVKKFKRAAHLEYIPMPGGDMAIREPWRMAASYIWKNKNRDRHYFSGKREDRKMVAVPIFPNINSPMTSSMGRLFDAVGSLVLDREDASFEAELPIELEKIVDKDERGCYDFDMKKKDGRAVINMAKTISGILKDLNKNVPKPCISAKFHNTIAFMILVTAKRFNAKKAVLSGGVFQNKFLSRKARELLEGHGVKVYTHSNVETNDSGIPLGQIAIASARLDLRNIKKSITRQKCV
jgi:hydrogenase maturation protein HypF